MLDVTKIKNELSKWLDANTTSNKIADLFETKYLSNEEITCFLTNEFNRKFIDKFIQNFHIDKHLHLYLDLMINDKTISYYKTLIKCICVNAILEYTNAEERNLSNESFEKEFLDYEIKKISSYDHLDIDEKVFFRGQSDYEWGLIPSMFRNYIFNTEYDGEEVDIKTMFEKYDKSGLIEKYNNTIAKKKINNYYDLDYGFISYMQHSLSYSPLIDITSKLEIGVQFALGNKSDVNKYLGVHSAVFAFKKNIDYKENKEININQLLKNEFRVILLKSKIKPGSKMKIEKSNGDYKLLDFTTIPKIIEILTPKYVIIEQMKNDRMKYQHGKFILFYNYVLVNNYSIAYYLNKNFKSTKYKILRKSKNGLHNYVNKKWPQYNMDYLLNPYDYFCK